MSWLPEAERQIKPWYQRLCIRILKSGPIPKHIAIIMDGNRRFATKKSIERAEGHLKGFDKLAETLDWCLDLGITEVTVYAFSIENFKRSKEEVDCLMELARQKFARLLEEKDLIEKHGVCVRVLGNLSLLPKDIQELVAEAISISRHNTRATLNVCFSYTSREEICMAMREVVEGVEMGFIKESDISEDLLEHCLYTRYSPHPDLLIRTSGEVRLSDFLLWQSCYSVLAFVSVLWPEFSIWHLFAAVLHYQKNYNTVQIAKQSNDIERERLVRDSDHKCVLDSLEEDKNVNSSLSVDSTNIQKRVQQYAVQREERISHFLRHLKNKEEKFIDSIASDKTCTFSTNNSSTLRESICVKIRSTEIVRIHVDSCCAPAKICTKRIAQLNPLPNIAAIFCRKINQ